MPPNRFVGEGIFAVGLRWPGAAIIAHGKNQSGVYVRGAFVTRSFLRPSDLKMDLFLRTNVINFKHNSVLFVYQT